MTTIDLIKTAYRQTKDGFAITFTVHPQDDHSELAKAEIGSQWQAIFTPLDDDGNPAHVLAAGREVGGPVKRAEPASRLTQLACICCNDPVFWRYLSDIGYIVTDKEHARRAVYELCDVDSRKEFIVGTPAGDRWLKFYDRFALWRDAA